MAIGTAAALGIGLASAGASAASNVYSTKAASRENRRAIEAQENEARRAQEFQEQQLRAQQEQAHYDRLSQQAAWEAYERQTAPMRAMSMQALAAAGSHLGIGGPPPEGGGGNIGQMLQLAQASRQGAGPAPAGGPGPMMAAGGAPGVAAVLPPGGGVGAPSPVAGGPAAAPRRAPDALYRSAAARSPYPTMAMPQGGGNPLGSIGQMMQLAQLAGPGQAPLPGYPTGVPNALM